MLYSVVCVQPLVLREVLREALALRMWQACQRQPQHSMSQAMLDGLLERVLSQREVESKHPTLRMILGGEFLGKKLH